MEKLDLRDKKTAE